MSSKKRTHGFDPYHRWFGIPPGKRPPTHYQLLGIASDETSAEVIGAAADRQTEFVSRFADGKHAEMAQRVLYEIEEAQLCLLNPRMRGKYDAQLRQQKSNARRKTSIQRRSHSSTRSSSVGEETEFVRSYLGIVSILVGAFLLVMVAGFFLPWGKFFAGKDASTAGPATQLADDVPAAAGPVVVAAEVVAPDGDDLPQEVEQPKAAEPAAEPEQVEEGEANVAAKPEGDAWIDLFNGQNLDGWKYATTDQSNNRTNTTWSVDADQGIIVSTGGDSNRIETEQEYQDFVLTLEYRELPVGEPSRANSGLGVLIRANGNAQVPLNIGYHHWMSWVNKEQKKVVRKRGNIIELDPNAVEVKLGNHHEGVVSAGCFHIAETSIKHPKIIDDRKPAKPLDKPMVLFQRADSLKKIELKPKNGWNSCEIRCQGDQVTVQINDQLVNKATGLEIRAGNIAIRNQSARAEIRNIRVQELDVKASENGPA